MNFLPPIDNPGKKILENNSVHPVASADSSGRKGTNQVEEMNLSTQELTEVGGKSRGFRDTADDIPEVGAGGDNTPGLNESNYPINFNFYAAKKTMAQGLMDIALLTANASQLKALLATDGNHQYYTFLITLTSISISLQILVAVIFLAVGRMDISVEKNQKILDVLNNVATAIVFVITVVNIFISAFGINDRDLQTA